jgi:hypothetical protein
MFQLTTPLVVALGCSVAAFASICFAHDPALHNDNAGLRGFEFATHDDQNHVVGSGDHLFLWNSDWLQLPGERELIGSTHGCIVTDAANQIYMSADTGDAVQVFAEDGTFVRSFGKDWGSGVHGLSIVLEVEENTTAAGTLNRIETEYLYIAHTAKQEILKTTLTGEVVMRIGIPMESGKYDKPDSYWPTSVAVAPDGRMFVADGYGL